VTYRDRPWSCPACPGTLVQDGGERRWRCPARAGVLLAGHTVTELLVEIAPELRPGVRGDHRVLTPTRRAVRPRPCAACTDAMTPVFLAGVEVERCYDDDLMWFDAGEVRTVLGRARDQHLDHTSPFARLARLLRW
jgi:hypothetical protein